MKPMLPKDWRRRRDAPARSGRFAVEGERGSWDVFDWAYAMVVNFSTKAEAMEAAAFAREYVKRHGDIDFGSFPYDLDQPLHYDDWEGVFEWWTVEYP